MLLTVSAILASMGVGGLRAAWSSRAGARRAFTVAGVIAASVAILLPGAGHGAWGVAVATIFVMTAATAVLAHSLYGAPPARRREPRRPSTPTVPLACGGWRGVARRVVVFLLIVPGGGAVSMMVALAAQAAARAGGAVEANSITLGLLAFPIVWSVLATTLMLEERAFAMLRPLLLIGGATATLFLLLN